MRFLRAIVANGTYTHTLHTNDNIDSPSNFGSTPDRGWDNTSYSVLQLPQSEVMAICSRPSLERSPRGIRVNQGCSHMNSFHFGIPIPNLAGQAKQGAGMQNHTPTTGQIHPDELSLMPDICECRLTPEIVSGRLWRKKHAMGSNQRWMAFSGLPCIL